MVKSKMNRAKYFAAITDHPYLSFTVHFTDDNWLFCLDTVPFFGDHTGQNKAEAIDDILENWVLVAITTDNGLQRWQFWD